jgi:hypothetical protein
LHFVVILYLELVRRLDPLTTGLIFVPIEAAVLGPLSGKLSDHYSARVLCSVGLLLNATATVTETKTVGLELAMPAREQEYQILVVTLAVAFVEALYLLLRTRKKLGT